MWIFVNMFFNLLKIMLIPVTITNRDYYEAIWSWYLIYLIGKAISNKRTQQVSMSGWQSSQQKDVRGDPEIVEYILHNVLGFHLAVSVWVYVLPQTKINDACSSTKMVSRSIKTNESERQTKDVTANWMTKAVLTLKWSSPADWEQTVTYPMVESYKMRI